MADAPLTFRLATEADVPALGALWAEDAGWGGLTAAQWRAWYVDTPYGACPVAVAVDAGGRAVGQLAFTPSRVRVGGAEVDALRLSAPILRRDRRRGLLDAGHPVAGMYFAVAHDALRRGVRLVYAVTDPAWLGFFGWAAREGARLGVPLADFAAASHACRARDVGAAGARGVARWAADPVDAFGAEFDAFWEEVAAGLDAPRGAVGASCAVARRPAWLNFKYGGDFLRVAVRERPGAPLAGYAAVRRSDGLLADVLARDGAAYAPVLAAVLGEAGRARAAGDLVPAQLRAMDAPALRPALDALGFVPVDYQFAFACAALPGGPAAERVAPARWHVTAGD